MINDGINDVPDKTIAIFKNPNNDGNTIPNDRLLNILKKPSKKRDWFDSHFYRCLPLTIGNQYGFVISLDFDFSFQWNGGHKEEDIFFTFGEGVHTGYPRIDSHFGHGILTINTPFFLRTPPGINLMTINPPNYVIPNITVMTGVIETDNLRRSFTFNLKIQIPNIQVTVPAGTPLAAFIPVPRYFCDEFSLEFAENIFTKEIIDEELQAEVDTAKYRTEVESKLKNRVGRHYFLGTDVYGNKFKDHQNP